MNLFPFVYDNQKNTFIILQFSYPNRLTHTHSQFKPVPETKTITNGKIKLIQRTKHPSKLSWVCEYLPPLKQKAVGEERHTLNHSLFLSLAFSLSKVTKNRKN